MQSPEVLLHHAQLRAKQSDPESDHDSPKGAVMTNRSTARDAIEQTLSAWAAAIRDADPDALGALVTEDAEFWTHGAPPLNGRRELIEAFEPFFAQFEMNKISPVKS
jgi:hypothetical protein